jgi:hypothetical protein
MQPASYEDGATQGTDEVKPRKRQLHPAVAQVLGRVLPVLFLYWLAGAGLANPEAPALEWGANRKIFMFGMWWLFPSMIVFLVLGWNALDLNPRVRFELRMLKIFFFLAISLCGRIDLTAWGQLRSRTGFLPPLMQPGEFAQRYAEVMSRPVD